METMLAPAAAEPAAWIRFDLLPAFLVLAALFGLADAGAGGLLVSAALAGAKAALVLYFFPDLGR